MQGLQDHARLSRSVRPHVICSLPSMPWTSQYQKAKGTGHMVPAISGADHNVSHHVPAAKLKQPVLRIQKDLHGLHSA